MSSIVHQLSHFSGPAMFVPQVGPAFCCVTRQVISQRKRDSRDHGAITLPGEHASALERIA